MLVSFGLGFLALGTIISWVDGQCMNLLSTKDQCRTGKGQYHRSLQLCLSTCLNKKECLMLQWLANEWKCIIFSQKTTVSSLGGECLTLAKVECQAFDHTCMEKTSGQVYNKNVSVVKVDELGCRVMCQLWPYCTAYTSLKKICYLQKGSSPVSIRGSNNQQNGEQGRKKTDCKTGERAITFRYGANSSGAKKTDVSNNVTRCFDLLLIGSKYSIGVWNIQAEECWMHKKANARSFFGGEFDLINFVMSTNFRFRTQKLCLKTWKGYKYEPSYGVLLEVRSKSECLHICLSTVNCHSVSWGGARVCYLHQVPASKKRNPDGFLHVVIPCNTDIPMTNSNTPAKVVSWCWRRVSSDVSNTRVLVPVAEVSSLLQCCIVCNRASHCIGVTWLSAGTNEKSCYIKTVKDGSPTWRVSLC